MDKGTRVCDLRFPKTSLNLRLMCSIYFQRVRFINYCSRPCLAWYYARKTLDVLQRQHRPHADSREPDCDELTGRQELARRSAIRRSTRKERQKTQCDKFVSKIRPFVSVVVVSSLSYFLYCPGSSTWLKVTERKASFVSRMNCRSPPHIIYMADSLRRIHELYSLYVLQKYSWFTYRNLKPVQYRPRLHHFMYGPIKFF